MKNLFFALSFVICFTNCKKTPPTSTDNPYGLPNISQSCENTFGCLANGDLFLAETGILYPTLICNYWFPNYGSSGHSFYLSAKQKGNSIYDLTIISLKKAVTIGEFDFGAPEVEGAFSAQIYDMKNIYRTEANNKGKIKIIKLDEVKQILSGTFWFDAVNDKGEKLEVREGRFDMVYRK